MKIKLSVLGLITLFISASANSQTVDEKYVKDVKSIDAIITAYYNVISGARTDPWQYERDTYLHSKTAIIVRLDNNGNANVHTLEAEYIPLLLIPKEDFYEIEIKRKVSEFGNMAQVWSAYEVRMNPETASNTRGLNSIQLHFENDRWFIDGWTTQMETNANTIVSDFLKTD
ncbi:hypothetical protein [Bizionia arctica]|uniref:Nuclear transport factor 2 family protein n=1 Tax=Bizionia arctica TaxID=1495645 RepID=A0A917LTV7_9FLAO|nr:hypothetical protein [Bizionia arctica]GGG57120.1 hypothetical protein GCM10010976_29950 [Bizionia arctica]